MKSRETKLLLIGLTIGMALAAGIFGTTHLLRPESSRAQEPIAEMPSSSHEHSSAGNNTTIESPQQTNAAPLSSLQLTDIEQTQIGVQTVEIQRRNLTRSLVSSARVTLPETSLASITARISGRIDKLYVDFTGQTVKHGQAVAEIYSPELYSTAQEYRMALSGREHLGANAEGEAVRGADSLIAAGRQRLELWGVTPKQIEQLAKASQPQMDLTIFANASGVVTERKVTQGQYVNAGDVLYAVADLSSVWIEADVYQTDLQLLRPNTAVTITSDALPGSTLQGRVSFIAPQVNPQTRTVPVHVHVANPGMRLRPGMFVQAKFGSVPGADSVAVPRSAVLDTGARKIVYVAKEKGLFEGREVQLGPPAEDFYPVISGLREGERVVTEGNFLIDSQTRIASGMSGLYSGSKEYQQPAGGSQMTFTFRCDPANPKGGDTAKVFVTAATPDGKAVSDAEIKVALVMPAMPEMNMPEMRSEAQLTRRGAEYAGEVRVPMSGTWNVEIEAKRGGQFLGSYRGRLMAR